VCAGGYADDPELDAKVCECLHISEVFERASEFDLIHNHFDFLPLTYSRLIGTPLVTTIHGFSSERIVPVYEKYDGHVSYVSISDSDRHPRLTYVATVRHGIDLEEFTFRPAPDEYLVFFGRIHPDKGAREAIEIARLARRPLILAGIVQDQGYFDREVAPHLDADRIKYVGSVGPRRRNELLGGAAALLHPIAFDEPFGLSVIESMACGTPVVAFDRGSMPELIEHGVCGFVVHTVEEAARAVGSVESLSRRACRRHVGRRFSADRMAEDYLRVYAQILRRPVATLLGGAGEERSDEPEGEQRER
jgi:glycosyltransferase involved in cell wall biosynthesis